VREEDGCLRRCDNIPASKKIPFLGCVKTAEFYLFEQAQKEPSTRGRKMLNTVSIEIEFIKWKINYQSIRTNTTVTGHPPV
jgi:hypothetical protein